MIITSNFVTSNMMMINNNINNMTLTPAVEPLLCLAEAQTPREPVKTSVKPPGSWDDDLVASVRGRILNEYHS